MKAPMTACLAWNIRGSVFRGGLLKPGAGRLRVECGRGEEPPEHDGNDAYDNRYEPTR